MLKKLIYNLREKAKNFVCSDHFIFHLIVCLLLLVKLIVIHDEKCIL